MRKWYFYEGVYKEEEIGFYVHCFIYIDNKTEAIKYVKNYLSENSLTIKELIY